MQQQEPKSTPRRLLYLLLLLAFVRGVLYLAIQPPWQHHDEPTHFEYVRLIAERRQLPQPGDFDLEMRREIAASIQAAGGMGIVRDPKYNFWSDEPPWIGISELGHPPLYYVLQALPQLLLAYQEVETQLYVARFVSVLIFVLVVGAAYGVVAELMPGRMWMPLLVATFIALLPAFTDLMTAVNNDVGAVLAVTLLIWASVRLIRRGPSLVRVAIMLILTAACFATKSTAAMAAVAILLALGASLVPSRHRRWLWLGLLFLIPVALVGCLTWGEHAVGWYSDYWTPASANRAPVATPLGRSAFALSGSGSPYTQSLFQQLERSAGHDLRGKTVTMGAWIRAEEDSSVPVTLMVDEGTRRYSHLVDTTTQWQFHAFTSTIAADAPSVTVFVSLPRRSDPDSVVYADGLILVEGEMATSQPPEFETAQGQAGQWGGQQFANLLRHGSAESSWPGLRRWIGEKMMYRQPLALVFHSLLDVPRTKWAYDGELRRLSQSFWGRFGWSHLLLPPAYYNVLDLVTAAAMVGSGLVLIRRLGSRGTAEPWQNHAWAVMGIVWFVGWGATVLRIHPLIISRNFIWPMARYATVAIVPTATFLCLGLREITPRRWQRWLAFAGLLGLVFLDAVALFLVIIPNR